MHHTIDVEGLCFTYPDGRQALRQVRLFIAPGEKVALVGPNGAGKSTLLLNLAGILRGEGRISVASVELSDATLKRIRASVGVVFQDPDDQLFSSTVFDDVAYGLRYMGTPKAEIGGRVADALGAVGMADSEARIPYHLSGGEKKRVAIATVLAMDPEILVLDEPTSGLDPRGRRGIMNLLRQLPQTMLVSTHDIRMVWELFPRVVLLNEGRIVADGKTQDVLSDAVLMDENGLEVP